VVDVELLAMAAELTMPTVALENSTADRVVCFWLKL
jgi:hypothetical protein